MLNLPRKPRFERLDSRICLAFGDIDLNFADGGRFEDSFEVYNRMDWVSQIVEEPDNSQLLVESIQTGSGHAVGFSKLDRQGQPIQDFGGDGSIEWFDRDHAESLSYAFRISNGNLIVHTYTPSNFSAAAFDSEGELVTSFADQGLLRLGRGLAWDSIPHPDGGFIVYDQRNLESLLTRFTNDGRLDTSFGIDGQVRLPAVIQSQMKIDPAGRILLFGSRIQNGQHNQSFNVIVRLLADGTLDDSFGANGTRSVAAPFLERMHMSPTGDSYFVIKYSDDSQYRTYSIERFSSEMILDETFGVDGITQLQVPKGYYSVNLHVRPMQDGGLIFEQAWREISGSRIVIGRINSDGSPDASFGDSGIAEHRLNGEIFSRGIHIDASGNLYWYGSQGVDGLTVRFTPSGDVDTSWADEGRRTVDRTVGTQSTDSLTMSASHRGAPLVVAGWNREQTLLAYGTGRLHVGDQTGIRLTTTTGNNRPLVIGARDGGWYHINAAGSNPYSLNIRRFGADATQDNSFGVGGVISVQVPYPHLVFARQDDTGAVTVVVGDHAKSSDPADGIGVAVLIRLTPDGQLDNHFAQQGVLRLYEQPDTIVDVMVSSSKGIVVVFRDRTLYKFNPRGQLDSEFGNAGIATVRGFDTWLTGEIDETGRILGVVAPDYRLLRLDSRGSLDTTFAGSGQVDLPWEHSVAYESAELAVRSGVVLLANAHGRHSSVVRLLAYDYHGNPLEALGGNGLRDYDFAENGELVTGLEFADDGSIWISLLERRGFNMVGAVYRLAGSDRSQMHNWYLAVDVNRDQVVSALDLLIVINQLNGGRWNEAFRPDVNNDEVISPLDLLLIVNHLNSQSNGEGELGALGQPFTSKLATDLSWLLDEEDEFSTSPSPLWKSR